MPLGYATANLLRHVNTIALDHDELAPEVEAPREYLQRHNTEYPTLVTRLAMAVGIFSLFAILVHDVDRRMNPPAPPVPEDVIAATLDRIPMHLPARTQNALQVHGFEVCSHMALTGTRYTFADCKYRDARGRVVHHREGM